MATIITGYPGDRACDFLLIVSLGVALLSSTAWLVAWCLPRQPATRHLVLVSALICCLGMPVLASVFTASGWTLIAIPLLPARPLETDSALAGVPAVHSRPVDSALQPDVPVALRGASPFVLDRGHPRAEKPRVGPAKIGSGKPVGLHDRGQVVNRTEWPRSYRAAATLAFLTWVCVSVLMLLNLARSYGLVRRLRRSASALRDATLNLVRDDIGRRLGLRRFPEIVVSRHVVTPLAVGLRRPIIVLPERLLAVVSPDEMRDVLIHEVAHIHRRDHLIVLLQELARALYWPILTVHGLIHELAQAREELCDNHVLRDRDALSYGETLLHLAELSWEARPIRVSVGILHWKGALERRIAGLLDQRRSTMTRNSRGLACLVALLFIGGGTIASATRFIAAETPRQSTVPKPGPDDPAKKKQAEASAKPAPKPAAGRTMLIHVVGPDGRPMAGVDLLRSVWTRKAINDRTINRVTDERGEARFTLPEGMYIYRLWASAKGYVPLFAHWEEPEDPEHTLPSEFTFRLERGTVIGGIVRNEQGKPIERATVEVTLKHGGKRDGRTGANAWLSEGNDAVTTDAEGRWTLNNVPPGDDVRVLLKFTHPDYISDLNGTLQEQQGVGTQALRARTATITMHRGLVTTGTVTDAEGKPVAGAVVVRGDRPYFEWGSQEVLTDARGVYRLPPLPRGPLMITVVAPGWMPAQKKLDLQPDLKPVDFHLEPGNEIRIRFKDRTGGPIPDVDVSINRWRGTEALYNNRHPNVINTQIPNQAGGDGLYHWSWAPNDAVTYQFWKEGYADRDAELVADGTEHTITLEPTLQIKGKVTDAVTGRPIDKMTVIPVLQYEPGQIDINRQEQKPVTGGTYTIEADRTDVAYRVRIEAEGYRTAMSEAVRVGVPMATLDFKLEPAPPARGRVVNAQGRPVSGARVYMATPSQSLGIRANELDEDPGDNQSVLTDSQGAFAFPAPFERYTLVATHDDGYAEVERKADQQPGDLALRAWASIEGRLMQAGQPVPSVSIVFQPMRPLLTGTPRIRDGSLVKTDQSGRFVFTRVPPIKSRLSSDGKEFESGTSQSVPMDLQPGERVTLDFGGNGTSLTGRVIASGAAGAKRDIGMSLHCLIRSGPGKARPVDLPLIGYDPQRGWNPAWIGTAEGLAHVQTLHHYLGTLDPQGRFRISGFPAGDYDLILALYEPHEIGCLDSPISTKLIRVQVTDDAARKPTLDLGAITVPIRPRPRPGEMAPDLAFTTFSGETVKLSNLRGRYVLLNFWVARGPDCLAELPALKRLHDTYGTDKRLVMFGLNLDDPNQARKVVKEGKLPWPQGALSTPSDDPILARYAISTVPAYVLIGPDGKLIHSVENAEEITEVVRRVLK